MTQVIGYIVPGITQGCVYALIALGFVLIYKCSGVFNLAQGELVILGAYLFYAFSINIGLPIWIGLLLTLASGVLLGLLIERGVIRPMVGQPVLGVFIMTLALGGLLRGFMMLGWGQEQLILPRLFPRGGISFAGASIAYDYFGFLIFPLLILIALTLYFRYSKTGLSMMAISEDQQTAQSLGISVKRIMAIVWVIAAVVAAIGGVLLSNVTGAHYTQVGMGMKALAVALIGGLESIPGVIVGGLIVGVIESLAAGYIDPLVGGGFRDVAAFLLMILVVIFKPHGLFGWKRIERV